MTGNGNGNGAANGNGAVAEILKRTLGGERLSDEDAATLSASAARPTSCATAGSTHGA